MEGEGDGEMYCSVDYLWTNFKFVFLLLKFHSNEISDYRMVDFVTQTKERGYRYSTAPLRSVPPSHAESYRATELLLYKTPRVQGKWSQ